MKTSFCLLFVFAIVFLSSCEKKNEDFQTASISDYAPYTVGKYITYKLDSLVYFNFGASSQVRSYEVKYTVDSKLPDTSIGTSYRIIRYIRKNPGDAFNPDATFEATYKNNSLEFVENNQRFIKLKEPIRNGYSWRGNSYIDTYSLTSPFGYLDGWDYTYDSVGVSLKVGNFTLDNTLKVNQREEVIGNPSDLNSYSEINRGVEKYAKGIGLVYRNFVHSEYQPPTPGRSGFYQGYGITLTMIDHN